MKKPVSRLVALLMALLLALGAMSTALAADDPLDTSKPVELVMYLMGTEPPRFQEMLKTFNAMSKEELNCTVSVYFIGWGDYMTAYPMLFTGGEEFDLIYAATWTDYANLAKRGAFLPLEDLLPIYCAESLKDHPADALYQATVDGHVYAYTSNLKTYSAYGAVVRGDLMDQYGITEINNLEDYGKYLQAVVDNNPEFTDPAGAYSDPLVDDVFLFAKGYYPLSGSTGGVYYVDTNAETPQVLAAHELPEFAELCAMMKDWSDAGYWPKNVLSIQENGGEMLKMGISASRVHNFDSYVGDYIQNPDEWDVRWFNLVPTLNHLSFMQDSMAVPASSKNPERALMLLDKMRTDERYYNLLDYGIEGVDHTFDENGFVFMHDNDLFFEQPGTWGFRMEKFHRQGVGSPPDFAEAKQALEDAVVPNIYRSFNMDTAPIKTEYAAMQNLYAQYYGPLSVGMSADMEGDMAKLAEQATAAGNEAVKAELQKQLDAFVVSYNAR